MCTPHFLDLDDLEDERQVWHEIPFTGLGTTPETIAPCQTSSPKLDSWRLDQSNRYGKMINNCFNVPFLHGVAVFGGRILNMKM